MSVGSVCNREVIVADKDSGIVDVARLMREYHVGSVVVTQRNGDGVRPIGIVTDRDLVVEVLAQEMDPKAVVLEDLMTHYPLVAAEDDEVEDAVELMRAKGVRRVPVVDKRGFVIGILAMDDLLWVLSREFESIVSLVERQQKNEEKRRRPH